MDLSRRQVLQVGGLSAAAVAGVTLPFPGLLAARSASTLEEALLPRPYRTDFVVPPDARPAETGVDARGPYATFVLNQLPGTARLLPSGAQQTIWGYQGITPGPTITVERGTRVIAKVRNRLPEVHPMFGHRFKTSTHLHGNASLPQYDGYASDLTLPGYAKVYEWPTSYNPGRTMWYHDHAIHTTAQHVYGGLLGMFKVLDPLERELLPQGRFDLPLIISDVMFAADGELGFDDRAHSDVFGDVVLVNGRPWPVLKVQRRVYRFRVLNASVSRSYRPVLVPEAPVQVVATDGGLMPVAKEVSSWRHAPAERYEVLIDFARFAAGQRVELRNLSNQNNRDFDHTDKIMAFDVTDEPVDTSDPTWDRIPTSTGVVQPAMNLRREQAVRRREMRLKKSDVTNEWSINDRTWRDVEASGFREVFADPDLDDVEIWVIDNRSGGWHHPLHVHLVDFQVLSRDGQPPFDWEMGAKDVVYVGESERVELLMRFGPHRGKYMIHCHNLTHEDHDMMAQFSVGLPPGSVDVNDPISTAPASWDTDGDDDVPPSVQPPDDESGEEAEESEQSGQSGDSGSSGGPQVPGQGGAPVAPGPAVQPQDRDDDGRRRRRRKRRRRQRGRRPGR